MPKYKVLQEFELEGAVFLVDSEAELTEEVAAPLVGEGKVALVGDQGSTEQTGEQAAQ